MKALFITFEGGEGAGKTTLIESIVQNLTLMGHPVLKTREPGGTKLGEGIRTILLDQKDPISPFAELSLFLASRAQHIAEIIKPALKSGKIVLCDRFNDSSIAYQGMARGLGMEKVTYFCDFISEGLKPNLTIYLDLDPQIGLKRAAHKKQHDRIESEALAFHRKIREGYLSIHKKEPERFRLIDATKAPKEVLDEAMQWISKIL